MNIEAMHVELAELLHETPWKEWKTYPGDWYSEDRLAAIKEELIDLHFFLNNMYIAVGVDNGEMQRLYEAKFEKNMARQAPHGAYR
jgi:predicted HAD superfamily Cof-like phosphohydrolase